MSGAVVLHHVHDDLALIFRTTEARTVFVLLFPELDTSGTFRALHALTLEESVAARLGLPVAMVTDALRELVEHELVAREERAVSFPHFRERQEEGFALLLARHAAMANAAASAMAEPPPPRGAPIRSRLPRPEDFVHPATSPMDGRLAGPILPGETPEERRMRLRCLAQKNRRDAKRQSLARSDRPSVLQSESEGMASMASPDGFDVASKRPQSGLNAASKRLR